MVVYVFKSLYQPMSDLKDILSERKYEQVPNLL